MTSRFAIHLGAPEAGWLPVTIVVDDARHEWHASDVRNDVLGELADAALALGEPGPVRATISIWLEPATIELRFVADVDSADVDVSIVDVDDSDHDTAILGTATMTRATARAAIVDALADLQVSTSKAVLDREWSGFPDAALRRLLDGRSIADLLVELRPPWRAIADLQRLRDELALEIGPRHPLFGIALKILAIDDDAGAYLVELASGADHFAVVTPTWSGAREAPPLPATVVFRDWRAFRDGV